MSSGDVTMEFDSGRSWQMPDMILHYMADHGWAPPEEFVYDVMHSKLVGGERLQTKSINQPTRVGYLSGPFTVGKKSRRFIEKLETLMKEAANDGNRIQYRGQ